MDYLEKFDSASRDEIEKLIQNKLSEALDEDQKENKISNLITRMRRTGWIKNSGSRKSPSRCQFPRRSAE